MWLIIQEHIDEVAVRLTQKCRKILDFATLIHVFDQSVACPYETRRSAEPPDAMIPTE